jgi:D-xylose transport system substrate-binding protein
VALAKGTPMEQIPGRIEFTTPAGNVMNAVLLAPVPITRDNLSVVVDAGWITKEALCQGVPPGGPAPCN